VPVIRSRLRPGFVAVRCALAFGQRASRLMAVDVLFPDIGEPMAVRVGFLRWRGEPCIGDAESVATVPASDHNV